MNEILKNMPINFLSKKGTLRQGGTATPQEETVRLV
jgi:hypothetical protein